MFIVLHDKEIVDTRSGYMTSYAIRSKDPFYSYTIGHKFSTMEHARKFATSKHLVFSFDEKAVLETKADLKAQILDENWRLLETYSGGSAVSESDIMVQILNEKKELWNRRARFRRPEMNGRFTLAVTADCIHGCIYPIPIVTCCYEKIEDARKEAIRSTIPHMYKLNGQLTDQRADILDSEMRLLETYISGFPEAKYLELKAKK